MIVAQTKEHEDKHIVKNKEKMRKVGSKAQHISKKIVLKASVVTK